MHGLALSTKEGLPFVHDVSLENSQDSYFCFWLALRHLLPYFFFLHWLLSLSLCMTFYAISSNIGDVHSIKQFANVFVFGDFNAQYKDWFNLFW